MSQTVTEVHPRVQSSQLSEPIELQPITSRPPSVHSDTSRHIVNNDQNEVENASHSGTKANTVLIITATTLVTGTASMLNGIITVSLPTLAVDLSISPDLLFWPTSIQALTCGCTLLLSGSIADTVGARNTYIFGTLLQTAFVLGCALSRNAFELILFRGLSGLAASFCLPSAVSIITNSFTGRHRNVAFAFMGGGQPAGFVSGLVLGGVFIDFASWRVGFYMSSAVTAITLALILWGLPSSATDTLESTWKHKWQQISRNIDWIGAIISSAFLALMSYVLVSVTGNMSNITSPSSIALLSIDIILIPAFILWVGRQERLGKPAIIPNSLWRNKVFTVICITVFFAWGAVEALETILTFYFQNVQDLSALQTSLRFLPAAATGILANIATGSLVHRAPANIIVVVGLVVTCVAPLVMAFSNPTSSYWTSGFLANLLNPIGSDALFTVASLLITSLFPAKTQGLAGGVFNTVSQIGKSVGLALVAVIASSVTSDTGFVDKSSPDALMAGYRAAFWFCFGIGAFTFAVALWGLRHVGKVGHKRD